MKYTLHTLNIRGKDVVTAHFDKYDPDVGIYMLSGEFFSSLLPEIMKLLSAPVKSGNCPAPVVVFCPCESWNGSYSPWPAPALNNNSQPFTGKGRDSIEFCGEIKAAVCQQFSICEGRENHFLLGYSLSGLCALYGMYISSDFAGAGCCSGSLWYDGWIDFMQRGCISHQCKVYLSIGKKEEKTTIPRMSSIGKDITRAYEILKDRGCSVFLRKNNGGHDYQVPRRLAGAILWLLTGSDGAVFPEG